MGKEKSVYLFLLLTPFSASRLGVCEALPVPRISSHTQDNWEPHRKVDGTLELLSPRSMFPAIQTTVVGFKWIDGSCPDVTGSQHLPQWLLPTENWRLSCTYPHTLGVPRDILVLLPLILPRVLAVGDLHKHPCSCSKSCLIKPGKCYWEMKQSWLHVNIIIICFRSQLGFIRYQSLKATFKQPFLPPSSK